MACVNMVIFIFIYVEIGDFEFGIFWQNVAVTKAVAKLNFYHLDWVIYQHKRFFIPSFKIWKLE